MQKILIVILLFTLHSNFVKSQSNILLMSGITIEGKNIQIDDEYISYDFLINDELTHNKLEKYRVFSIIDENKVENVIYTQDSTQGRYYNVDEMRTFLIGEQDAKKYDFPLSQQHGAE